MTKRVSTTFLQAVLVLMAIGMVALMLWAPLIEGGNADATLFQVYFADPFLAYAYLSSIPFFTALYQAFVLLGYIERNQVFTPQAVRALRAIQYCGLLTAGLVAGAVGIVLLANDGDDAAGFVAMAGVTTFASIVVATAAAVFARMLQVAVDIKSENDLTV